MKFLLPQTQRVVYLSAQSSDRTLRCLDRKLKCLSIVDNHESGKGKRVLKSGRAMEKIGWILSPRERRRFEQLSAELRESMIGLYDSEWIDETINDWEDKVRHMSVNVEDIFDLMEHEIRENNWIRSPQEHGNLLECACCGYLTLVGKTDPLEHANMCPVCGWEDVFDPDPNKPSYDNLGLTLTEARENFRKFGACDPELKRIVILDPNRHFKRSRK